MPTPRNATTFAHAGSKDATEEVDVQAASAQPGAHSHAHPVSSDHSRPPVACVALHAGGAVESSGALVQFRTDAPALSHHPPGVAALTRGAHPNEPAEGVEEKVVKSKPVHAPDGRGGNADSSAATAASRSDSEGGDGGGGNGGGNGGGGDGGGESGSGSSGDGGVDGGGGGGGGESKGGK